MSCRFRGGLANPCLCKKALQSIGAFDTDDDGAEGSGISFASGKTVGTTLSVLVSAPLMMSASVLIGPASFLPDVEV